MALEFEDGTTDDILPDGAEPTQNSQENSQGSGELSCEVCGTPLVYAGTGRKPKRCPEHRGSRGGVTAGAAGPRGGSGRSSGSVEQAVATLGNVYDLVGMALFFATPTASGMWTQGIPELQTRNRAILSGDPELTRSINRLGVKGGKFAFVAVQVSAIAPPAMVAAQALRQRADERNAQARREQMRKNSQSSSQPNSSTGTDGGPNLGPNRSFFE